MNRCQVINTVKTFRFINSIERTNKIFTTIIIILTVATVALTFVSTMQSKESSQQMERFIQSQEQKTELIVNEFIEHLKTQNTAIRSLIKQHNMALEKPNDMSDSGEAASEKANANNASNK